MDNDKPTLAGVAERLREALPASTNRVDPRAGFVDASKATECRECGMPRPKEKCGWRTFCSDACVHAWKLRSQPGYAAMHVLKRDAGVCASCSLDCVALLTELKVALLRQRKEAGLYAPPEWDVRAESFDLREGCFADRIRAIGLTGERARLRRRLWEMDHIVPVVEGGGSCGLDNLRTLCIACHRVATAELRARLSVARKVAGKP